MVDHEAAVRTKFLALRPVLDERLSRLWAGAEAEALGDGGIAIVERATGLSRTTIRAGRDELRAGVSVEDVVLVRRAGGGRPRIEDTTPEIVAVLESLVDPVTRGDPESPLRWTSKSTRKLATELTAQGYAVSAQKVGQLLTASGYSRVISTDILQFRGRVLVIHAAKGGYGRAALISDTVLPVHWATRDPLLPGNRLQTNRPAGCGGRLSVIRQPRRWMDTSRRSPIGWPRSAPGGRRLHVPSSLLGPRPLCRSTSRQASVRETPNGAAPGCVPGRRTRLIAGPS